MPLHMTKIAYGSESPATLRAWLESGSREDLTESIGQLTTPALILAGAKDAALGLDAQRSAMAPHFASGRLHVLADTGHLIPLRI